MLSVPVMQLVLCTLQLEFELCNLSECSADSNGCGVRHAPLLSALLAAMDVA